MPALSSVSAAQLLWGVLFSAIGTGYLVYGKRQGQGLILVCGLGLIVYPYFVDGTWTQFIVGALLSAAPFLRRD